MNKHTGRRPTQKRAIDRVELILNSALKLFGRHGFDAVSVKDIADEAGITSSSVYQYFKDKRSIIDKLGKRLNSQLITLINSFKDDLESPEQVSEYAKFLIEQAKAVIKEEQGWMAIADQTISTQLNATTSINVSPSELSTLFYEKIKHIVPAKAKKQLKFYCFWWCPACYTAIHVNMQSNIDKDFELDLMPRLLETKIQELIDQHR